jgi:hypothetical protein
VLWLILFFALLNLGLGYVAACSLGQGPPGLIEAWDALCAGPRRAEPETPSPSKPFEDAVEPSADAPFAELPEPLEAT